MTYPGGRTYPDTTDYPGAYGSNPVATNAVTGQAVALDVASPQAGMLAWRIDDILFDATTLDRNGVQWIPGPDIKGFWGSPATKASVTEAAVGAGGFITPSWKKERLIDFSGTVVAPDHGTLRRAQLQIESVCSDPYANSRISCITEVGELYCNVRLGGEILVSPIKSYTPKFACSISLIARDPRKYDAGGWPALQTGLAKPSADGILTDTVDGAFAGISTTMADPADATKQGIYAGTTESGGVLVLTNRGNAPTEPVFTLYGPLQKPVLTNSQTGQRLAVNFNLGVGDVMVINTRARMPYVTLNGVRRRDLVTPAQWSGFSVPKMSTIRVALTHATTYMTGYVTAAGSDAYQ